MTKATLFFAIFCSSIIFGQNTVRGTVVDKTSGQPLAFANLIFDDNPDLRSTADLEGRFIVTTTQKIEKVTCSYLGYEKVTVAILSPLIEIRMQTKENKLTEISVGSRKNPANEIMRKVIANKNRNNPENIAAYRYRCYHKSVYDFKSNQSDKTDSIFMRKKLKDGHLFIMESVTERKYLRPDLSEEIILATKVSGFKNPSFAALATDLQPFSFYQDHIKLIDLYYLNPISRGSLRQYHFKLEETLPKDHDTIFVISFQPKKNKNFDALQGMLYINSKGFAVQNVIAYPAEPKKVNLKIKQEYQYLEKGYWFPSELNYSLWLTEYPNKQIGIIADGKSYLKEVEIDPELHKSDFKHPNVSLDGQAAKKDETYWNDQRTIPLTDLEKRTYTVVDSIGKKYHFDNYLDTLEKLSRYTVPLSVVDLDLTKIVAFNQYEGVRLGTGWFTNEKISEKLRLGGFFGYGFKDRKWKHGLEVKYLFNGTTDYSSSFSFQDNLVEIGSYGMAIFEQKPFSLRTAIAYRFDRVKQYSWSGRIRPIRYLQAEARLTLTEVVPKYGIYDPLKTSNYSNTEAALFLHFARGEKTLALFGNIYHLNSDHPVFCLYYAHGFEGIGQSQFNYNKLESSFEYAFVTPNFGKTCSRLETGYVDNGAIPLGLLFTGKGSYDADYPFTVKNYFQVMKPYEFISDRYVNLFLSHHFGGLLYKTGNFQPDISVNHNLAWGDLHHSGDVREFPFNTPKKIYLEAGLQFDSLLRTNFLNLGSIGLGLGGYYRYGAYHLPKSNDNIAFKTAILFSLK